MIEQFHFLRPGWLLLLIPLALLAGLGLGLGLLAKDQNHHK